MSYHISLGLLEDITRVTAVEQVYFVLICSDFFNENRKLQSFYNLYTFGIVEKSNLELLVYNCWFIKIDY
jgi:hypothetical protein